MGKLLIISNGAKIIYTILHQQIVLKWNVFKVFEHTCTIMMNIRPSTIYRRPSNGQHMSELTPCFSKLGTVIYESLQVNPDLFWMHKFNSYFQVYDYDGDA